MGTIQIMSVGWISGFYMSGSWLGNWRWADGWKEHYIESRSWSARVGKSW